MYRLIEVNQNDKVLDAACGSGAFLVKAMCNMMKEAGGINTKKLPKLKILSYMVLNLIERYLLSPVQICLFIKTAKQTWNT